MTMSEQLREERRKLFGVKVVSQEDAANGAIPDIMKEYQVHKQKMNIDSVNRAVNKITFWLANEKKVEISDIYSNRRFRALTDSRHILFFLLYFSLPVTQMYIGSKFDKHHTSVVHSIRKVKDIFADSLDFQAFMTRFKEFYFNEVI
jgi:chromosomal replication initiation ATPase DnaA